MSRVILIICALATGAISSVTAQDGARALHWRRIDVDARLDADGRLHVVERQAMVFTGDWNGGERTFNLRPGQRLDLNRTTRFDPGGRAHPLRRGDLDAVDEFDWTNSKTLRWRSRLPTDPPFASQQIIYELAYTLSNILVADGAGYQLDHDFAFPDRLGSIESFSLVFAAADAWRSPTPLPLRLERANIPPGESVVVTIPLQYTGAGQPAGVARGLPLAQRMLLALLLAGMVSALLRRFFAEEKARGRFEPIMAAEAVDREWLGRHVFNLPPEVVGAAWDNTTSAPEVAALIARMVLEGKLASRVEARGRKQVLQLELKVPRTRLSGDEHNLVDALFESGADRTDTEQIKQRYKKSGFDPAKLISPGIKKQIDGFAPNRSAGIDWGRVLINIVVALVVTAAAVAALSQADGSFVTVTPVAVGFLGLVALTHAALYRADVVDTRRRARRMTTFLLLAAAPVMILTLGLIERGATLSLTPLIAPAQAGWLLALIVMIAGITFLVLRAARTREDPERLALRRTLAAGRAFFLRELRQPQPLLDDAWFPYLLAFGLGKHIDKWFRAFGAEHATGQTAASAPTVSAASGGGWSGGGPLFGGGGGFGGGGTGRTWAASVATLSAGVAAPSSSGSGGGGGGSSGGGGGGGW